MTKHHDVLYEYKLVIFDLIKIKLQFVTGRVKFQEYPGYCEMN